MIYELNVNFSSFKELFSSCLSGQQIQTVDERRAVVLLKYAIYTICKNDIHSILFAFLFVGTYSAK